MSEAVPFSPYYMSYYSCSCHRFYTWADVAKANRQRFKAGDTIQSRCHKNVGVITKSEGEFVLVDYLNFHAHKRYRGQHHVSELLPIKIDIYEFHKNGQRLLPEVQ